MVRTLPLGLQGALKLVLGSIHSLPSIQVELLDGMGCAVAADIPAKVDSPSIDASLKDGYAVISREVENASREQPVQLKLTGRIAAGDSQPAQVRPNTTVRVLTGAKIPPGADAVVSEEFTQVENETVKIFIDAAPGRNILPKGTDVATGQVVVKRGSLVTPGLAGILAAAGHQHISVVRRPKVAIISTGDEVIAPGQPLPEGTLYASNMITLGGWCKRFGMPAHLEVVKDNRDALYRILKRYSQSVDAIVTSGGAWSGDRDLVVHILNQLGWQQIFHRIRIGPGKAVGYGLLEGKPTFILPGGPPSNLIGFLQIALPGLLKLAGHRFAGLPTLNVRLGAELSGRHLDWTQFRFGTLERDRDVPVFHALENKSRLQSMAEAQAVVAVPEGETLLPAGKIVTAQLLG